MIEIKHQEDSTNILQTKDITKSNMKNKDRRQYRKKYLLYAICLSARVRQGGGHEHC